MQHQDYDKRSQPEQANGGLFECYAASVFAYIRLHTPSWEDAEDLLLEVFMAAWEQGNLSWLAEKQRLVWLRRVAHNKLVDRYRRSSRSGALSFDHMLETLRSPEALMPEQVVLQREELTQLSSLVETLPLFQRQVLQLRVGDGLRFAEIAVLLNKREATVRKVFSRTLAQLRMSYKQQEKGMR
jgi:RNA polymerase sigma factor (sigma-70 family)